VSIGLQYWPPFDRPFDVDQNRNHRKIARVLDGHHDLHRRFDREMRVVSHRGTGIAAHSY
jgi:hypothetical protein